MVHRQMAAGYMSSNEITYQKIRDLPQFASHIHLPMHLFASRQVTAYFYARYEFSFTFPALQNLHIMPHDALQLSPRLLGPHPDYEDAAGSQPFFFQELHAWRPCMPPLGYSTTDGPSARADQVWTHSSRPKAGASDAYIRERLETVHRSARRRRADGTCTVSQTHGSAVRP